MGDTGAWDEDRYRRWDRYGKRREGHGRRFRRGLLKLAMLKFLEVLPRHGYDLMREFREHGWSAGPGSIYPLLGFLESEGYVTSRQEGDRRTYQVTEKGRTLLHDRADEVAAFFATVTNAQEEPADELQHALERLSSAIEQLAQNGKPESIARVKEMLDRTRKDIYTLLAQE